MTSAVTSIPRKALIYARVSTVEQSREDATSLDQQVERCKGYAVAQGWTVAEVFVDAGVSGAKPLGERPQGAELLAAIERGEGNAVIVLKVDRFTRSLVDSSTLEEWSESDIAFASVAEDFDTSKTTGRLMLDLLQVFAKFERDRIAERHEDGRRGIVESDKYRDDDGRVWRWVSGQLPYGYESDRITKLIGIDEQAAENVRRIFELRGTGMSSPKIADALTAEGRKTRPRTRTSKERGQYETSRAFTSSMVQTVLDLTRGHYLGNGIERYISKKDAQPVVFAAPAILDPEHFEMATKAAKSQRQIKSVGVKVNKYALSHRMRHAHADGSVSGMFGITRPSKGFGNVRFYRCSAARGTNGIAATCDGLGEVNAQMMTSVNADLVEAAFLRAIFTTTPEQWERLLRAKHEATQAAHSDVDVVERTARLVELRKERTRNEGLLATILAGDFEGDDLVSFVKPETVAATLTRLDLQIEGIEEVLSAVRADVAALEDIRSAVADLKDLAGTFGTFDAAGAKIDGRPPAFAAGTFGVVEESDHALAAAFSHTLDATPDRYGRSPLLPKWVVAAAEKWVNALDAEVTVRANPDSPRRPYLTLEVSGSSLSQSRDSLQMSVLRTGYRDRDA